MNDETIYKGLRVLYNRGELLGNDLKEFRTWDKAKMEKQEFNLIIDGCPNGDRAIENMVTEYKVKNLEEV